MWKSGSYLIFANISIKILELQRSKSISPREFYFNLLKSLAMEINTYDLIPVNFETLIYKYTFFLTCLIFG